MSTNRKILLVEDDPMDVELSLTALSEYKIANCIDVARDGAEALDYLFRRGTFKTRDEQNPVLVILDLKLPKVSGLEVLRELKADPKLKMIPVVILTSSREEKDLIASYKLGVNAYVVKPVEFHKFIEAVKELGLFWMVMNEVPDPKL